MISDLVDLYVEGKPADQQSRCIEAFFDDKDPTWIELKFSPQDGSDGETYAMIDHALNNFEYPEHIRVMLGSWRTEGF